MACLAGLVAGIVFAVLMASIPSAETRAMVTTLFLLGPSWRHRPPTEKRRFVDRFLVRALVP